MSRKFMPSLVHSLRLLWHRRSGNAGFTLIEVLIASAIGSIMISSLLWLVVQLVSSDRREAALAESDREVQLALDYITTDLRESVYVYDGSCSNPDNNGPYCPSYASFLPASLNDADSIPVLAFWKTEALDLCDLEKNLAKLSGEDPPDKCEDLEEMTFKRDEACKIFSDKTDGSPKDLAAQECEDLLYQRTAYTLVVYVHEFSSSTTWSGESRITRYELDKYKGDPILDAVAMSKTLSRHPGYVDPAATGVFRTWPFNASGINCQTSPSTCQIRGADLSVATPTIGLPVNSPVVLIDFAAHPSRKYNSINDTSSLVAPIVTDPVPSTLCPTTDYVHTPRTDNGTDPMGDEALRSRNFYACIRRADSGQFQDIIVYLRGNPKGRSGVQTDVIMPLYQTQITMRGVIDRNPTN